MHLCRTSLTSLPNRMRKRLIKLLFIFSLILTVGAAYALFSTYVFAVPCVFHTVTGLNCPGCGISRMCLSLLRGDFLSAIRYNLAIFALSPLFLVLIASQCVYYVKYGTKQLKIWQNAILYVCIVVLVLFGILRNIPAFSFLSPV